MRTLLAAVLAGLFLVLFLLAVTLNQVVDTASNPEVIIGMVNDAEVYDYVYDDIIANLVSDMVDRGLEVDAGLGEPSNLTLLQFDDSDVAAATITELIETLLPREYVREKFEQSLISVGSYARGEADGFTIDLDVQERVRAAPSAIRQVVSRLDLTEQVIDDLLVPQLDEFSSQISGEALGINFTPQEIEEAARLIFAPEWLETQLFGAIDEITPYFAGDADSFTVALAIDDRVVIIGQILKDKLNTENTLYNLVFAQVIDPLIQQTVAQSTSVGFGISLTEQEVVDAFEVIAPRDWVREQGDGVIDALVNYLVGTTGDLSYSVDLAERKTAAIVELRALARKKLETTLGDLPACKTPNDAIGASQDLAARQLPRCIAGGETAITIALGTFGPIMDAQVGSFVGAQVPSQLSYGLSDFQSQVGGGLEVVSDVRRRVIEGVRFTEQDLIDVMADGNDPNSRADAEALLQILADGVVITEKNIVDNLDPAALQQLDDVRGYVNRGLSLRWLLWVVVLIPLIAIGFIGGRGWTGRLKWAGGVAAVGALVIYAAISIAWSFNGVVLDRVPDFGANVSDEFRIDFPLLAGALEDGSPNERFERSLDSWQNGWRNQTVPWFIAGTLAFVAGFAWPRVQARRSGVGTTPRPPVSQPAPSTVGGSSATSGDFVIPADRAGEDPIAEEDRPTARTADIKDATGEDDTGSGSESGPEQVEGSSVVADPPASESVTAEDDSDSETKLGPSPAVVEDSLVEGAGAAEDDSGSGSNSEPEPKNDHMA